MSVETDAAVGESPPDAVHVVHAEGGRNLIVERLARVGTYAGKHRLVEVDDTPTEALPIVAEVRELLRLADQLTQLGADVRVVGHEPNGPCTWCQLEGHDASVAVYGDPAPGDPENPLHYAETCRVCARCARRSSSSPPLPANRFESRSE